VAGKTFRGLGKDEDPAPDRGPAAAASDFDEDDDARSDHSSPTIVDDKKVEEVLKKLRALDGARGGAARVTEVVVDANSSEPTRLDSGEVLVDTAPHATSDIDTRPNPAPEVERPSQRTTAKADDEIVRLAQRATSIGRSLSTPAGGQPVTIAADAARGTMFGRSIHLPEVNAPDDASIELSSGAVHFLDGEPPSSQPFPLADAPVEPAGAVPVPEPSVRPAFGLGGQHAPTAVARRAPVATPFDRSYGTDPRGELTDLRPRRSGRIVAVLGGLSLVGAAWFGWTQFQIKRPTPGVGTPAATAQPAAPAATAPAIAPLPSAAAPEPTAAPPPAAAAPAPIPPATDPAPTAAAAPAADEPPTAAPASHAPPPATRHGSTRREHRAARTAAAAPASPEGSEAAALKPTPSHHRTPAPGQDPDDTLPPSD